MSKSRVDSRPESAYNQEMNESENNSPRRKYTWPWFVLAAVVLAIVLAVIWVGLAAKKVEEQRDFGQPLPSTAPMK